MLRIRDYITFELVVKIIYYINAFCYAFIGMFAATLSSAANNRLTDAAILMFLFLIIYLFLPLPLALIAHENKRNIEKYIHLIYITFAPLLFFTFFDSTEDYFIPPLYIVIFILTLPLFFLFKNLYLYYRNKRLNKLQLEERSLREYITKIIEELTTLIKHPKDLVSNEEKYESVSSLDKIPDFIKCIIAGIIVGIVAGFSAGIIVDFSVGFIVGIVAGFLAGFLADTSAGSAKYAIVDTSIGFLVGAIAGLLASVFIDVFAGLLASVFIGLMTSFIVGTIIRFAKYTNTDSAKCAIVKAITATIAGAITSSIIGASIGYIFYNRLF